MGCRSSMRRKCRPASTASASMRGSFAFAAASDDARRAHRAACPHVVARRLLHRVRGQFAQMAAREHRARTRELAPYRRSCILRLKLAGLPLPGQQPQRIEQPCAHRRAHVGLARARLEPRPARDRRRAAGWRRRRRSAAEADRRRTDAADADAAVPAARVAPAAGGACCGGRRVRIGRQRHDRRIFYRVNGAKSVDTASSFALKAKQSAGRNWPHSESASLSTARSFARSSVHEHAVQAATVQSSPGTGGTASSTVCGAHASGGLYWNVMAVVSSRLGTISVHSSIHRPRSGCAKSSGASALHDERDLSGRDRLARSGGKADPPIVAVERQLRDRERQTLARAQHLRAGEARRQVAPADRARAHSVRTRCRRRARRRPASALLAASAARSSPAVAASHVKRGSTTNDAPKTARMRSSSCASTRARIGRGGLAAKRRDLVDALAAFRQQRARLLRSAARAAGSSPAGTHGTVNAKPKSASPRIAVRRASALAPAPGCASAASASRAAISDASAATTRASSSARSTALVAVRDGGERSCGVDAARGREQPSRGTRLLQHVEERELAAREIGRARVLDAPRARRGAKPSRTRCARSTTRASMSLGVASADKALPVAGTP